jgi:hypothetical protein
MEIKASIRQSPNGYGFGLDWTLVITKDGIPRSFWLGQAAKYCHRAGIDPEGLKSYLEVNNLHRDLNDPEVNEKLAWYIIETITPEGGDYEVTAEYIHENTQSWELSCE